MDKFQALMAATFAVAVLSGRYLPSRALAMSLSFIAPVIGLVLYGVSFNGPGIGEAALFLAPMIGFAVLVFAVLSFLGVRLGQEYRAKAAKQGAERHRNDDSAAG